MKQLFCGMRNIGKDIQSFATIEWIFNLFSCWSAGFNCYGKLGAIKENKRTLFKIMLLNEHTRGAFPKIVDGFKAFEYFR